MRHGPHGAWPHGCFCPLRLRSLRWSGPAEGRGVRRWLRRADPATGASRRSGRSGIARIHRCRTPALHRRWFPRRAGTPAARSGAACPALHSPARPAPEPWPCGRRGRRHASCPRGGRRSRSRCARRWAERPYLPGRRRCGACLRQSRHTGCSGRVKTRCRDTAPAPGGYRPGFRAGQNRFPGSGAGPGGIGSAAAAS